MLLVLVISTQLQKAACNHCVTHASRYTVPMECIIFHQPSEVNVNYHAGQLRKQQNTCLCLLGREADHSPPNGAEVKNMWSYTSTSPYIFMELCLVKYNIRLHGMVFSYAQGQLYLNLTYYILQGYPLLLIVHQ